MNSAEDVLRALVGSVVLTTVVRNAPALLQQFYAVKARIEAQPSPATFYLQRWHNR